MRETFELSKEKPKTSFICINCLFHDLFQLNNFLKKSKKKTKWKDIHQILGLPYAFQHCRRSARRHCHRQMSCLFYWRLTADSFFVVELTRPQIVRRRFCVAVPRRVYDIRHRETPCTGQSLLVPWKRLNARAGAWDRSPVLSGGHSLASVTLQTHKHPEAHLPKLKDISQQSLFWMSLNLVVLSSHLLKTYAGKKKLLLKYP